MESTQNPIANRNGNEAVQSQTGSRSTSSPQPTSAVQQTGVKVLPPPQDKKVEMAQWADYEQELQTYISHPYDEDDVGSYSLHFEEECQQDFFQWLTLQEEIEEDVDFDTETTVSVEGFVDSLSRSVDAMYGTAVFTLTGRAPCADHCGFTREFEQVGHMAPNLLFGTANADDEEVEFKRVPDEIPSIDLGNREHYLVGWRDWEHRTGFHRINLFCKKILAIAKESPNEKMPPIAFFCNVKSCDFGVIGYNASAGGLAAIAEACPTIEKPDSERTLVEAAIRRGGGPDQAQLCPYIIPGRWLNDPDTHKDLRVWLRRNLDCPVVLPRMEGEDVNECLGRAIAILIQRARNSETYDEGATLKRLLALNARFEALTVEQQCELYQAFTNLPEVRAGDCVKIFDPILFPRRLPPSNESDFSPDFVQCQEERTRVRVDYEGMTYWCPARRSSDLAPPSSFGHILVGGGSVQLNEALTFLGPILAREEVVAMFIAMKGTFRSSCLSVTTQARLREQGRHERGILWSEELIVNLEYYGLFLLPKKSATASAKRLARRINNQLVAETVRSALEPANLFVGCHVGIPVLDDHVGDGGEYSPYLAGTHITSEGKILCPSWQTEPLATSLNGAERRVPIELLALGLHFPERVKIVRPYDSLAGRCPFGFSLKHASNDEWESFTYGPRLNLDVDAKESPADWYAEMMDIKNRAPVSRPARPSGKAGTRTIRTGIRRTADPSPVAPSQDRGEGPSSKPANAGSQNPSPQVPANAGKSGNQGTARAGGPSKKKSGKQATGASATSSTTPSVAGDSSGQQASITPARATAITSGKGPSIPSSSKGPQKKSAPPPMNVSPPGVALATPGYSLPDDLPDFELGNWLCKRVQKLSVDERRYWASRATDKGRGVGNSSVYTELHTAWVNSIMQFVAVPNGKHAAGCGRNWYVEYSEGWRVPPVLRTDEKGVIAKSTNADNVKIRKSVPPEQRKGDEPAQWRVHAKAGKPASIFL